MNVLLPSSFVLITSIGFSFLPAEDDHVFVRTPEGVHRGWSPVGEQTIMVPKLFPATLEKEQYLDQFTAALVVPWHQWSKKSDDPKGMPVSALFQEMDDDRVRYLWYELYLHLGPPRPVPGIVLLPQKETSAAECVRFLFDRYDTNHDGQITLCELGELGLELSPSTWRSGSTGGREMLYQFCVWRRYLDVNGDGEIDTKERAMGFGLRTEIEKTQGNPDHILSVSNPQSGAKP